jgi:hypothetical protein
MFIQDGGHHTVSPTAPICPTAATSAQGKRCRLRSDSRDFGADRPQWGRIFAGGLDRTSGSILPSGMVNEPRVCTTLSVCLIALVTTMASAIDSAVISEASAEFGASEVTESLATGIYLIGFGAGALVASPLSEMIGRYPVYLGALVIFGSWNFGAALAPNIGGQLVFRFLAGLCGAAPLTVAGGSISGVWNTLEKTFGFPAFAIPAFGGPTLGNYLV